VDVTGTRCSGDVVTSERVTVLEVGDDRITRSTASFHPRAIIGHAAVH
jgi:hypothetical protein